MSTNDAARATGEALPEETRGLGDAHDIIARAKHLNELVFMAGGSLRDRAMANAFTTGADMIDDLLRDAQAIIEAVMDRKGGEA